MKYITVNTLLWEWNQKMKAFAGFKFAVNILDRYIF